MSKMKVLFVTRKWAPAIGGMETYSMELVKQLKTITDLSLIKLNIPTEKENPRVFSLFIFLLKSLKKIITSPKYDVVHIGDLVLWPLIIPSVFLKNSKCVITTYGLDVLYTNKKGILPKVYYLYLKLGQGLINRYCKILAISNATKEVCMEFGFNNVEVVTLGVNYDKHSFKAAPAPRMQSERYILFVGRIVKRKGLGWFVSNVLPRIDNSVRLKVVGIPTDEEETMIVKNSSSVDFLGKVTDKQLVELRSKADIVIMPNIKIKNEDMEGFGLVALETVASGGVLIASNLEGIKDAVINDKTGFLLPPEASDEWVKKIDQILLWENEDKLSFVSEAQEIVRNKYSWRAVAINTVKEYRI